MLRGGSHVRAGLCPSGGVLPPAPTRLGREVPAIEVRPGIPEALSALAERALHPEEPDGIHAVSAIAALLRKPEPVAGAPAATPAAPPVPQLSPAERRLIKERRIKLGVAGGMLAAFSALIILIVASMAKQVMASIGDPQVLPNSITAPLQSAGGPGTSSSGTPTGPGTTTGTTDTTTPGPTTKSTPSTSTQLVAPVAVKIASATVFDPEGDWRQGGSKDNVGQVPRAFDGDPTTSWKTYDYNQQFPVGGNKQGVGLTLELDKEVTAASVTVTSDTPDTTVEVRSAPGPDADLSATKVLGSGTITNQPVTINLTGATKSKYLIVWFTKLAPKPDSSKFKSDLTEVSVTGRP